MLSEGVGCAGPLSHVEARSPGLSRLQILRQEIKEQVGGPEPCPGALARRGSVTSSLLRLSIPWTCSLGSHGHQATGLPLPVPLVSRGCSILLGCFLSSHLSFPLTSRPHPTPSLAAPSVSWAAASLAVLTPHVSEAVVCLSCSV